MATATLGIVLILAWLAGVAGFGLAYDVRLKAAGRPTISAEMGRMGHARPIIPFAYGLALGLLVALGVHWWNF